MPKEQANFTIAEAVSVIRDQIVEARDRVKDTKGVNFSLKEVEVELQLVAEETDGDNGKVGLDLVVFKVEVGGNTGIKSSRTHTIRFKLDVEDEHSGGGGISMNDD